MADQSKELSGPRGLKASADWRTPRPAWHILVADDDPASRELTEAILRQAGFLNGPSGLGHTGHTLGSTQRAPGGTWTPGPQGLTCSDCHDPHGEIQTDLCHQCHTQGLPS